MVIDMIIQVKKSNLSLVLVICLITSAYGQAGRIVRSEGIEDNLALTVELNGTKYQEGDIIEINYRVSNKSNQDIFLVTGLQPDVGYNPEHKDIGINLFKTVFTYHYFEFPNPLRIKPGGIYTSKISIPVLPKWIMEREEKNKRSVKGIWYFDLSVGYLDKKGMAEINAMLKQISPNALGRPFDEAQKFLSAGPIQIEITAP